MGVAALLLLTTPGCVVSGGHPLGPVAPAGSAGVSWRPIPIGLDQYAREVAGDLDGGLCVLNVVSRGSRELVVVSAVHTTSVDLPDGPSSIVAFDKHSILLCSGDQLTKIAIPGLERRLLSSGQIEVPKSAFTPRLDLWPRAPAHVALFSNVWGVYGVQVMSLAGLRDVARVDLPYGRFVSCANPVPGVDAVFIEQSGQNAVFWPFTAAGRGSTPIAQVDGFEVGFSSASSGTRVWCVEGRDTGRFVDVICVPGGAVRVHDTGVEGGGVTLAVSRNGGALGVVSLARHEGEFIGQASVWTVVEDGLQEFWRSPVRFRHFPEAICVSDSGEEIVIAGVTGVTGILRVDRRKYSGSGSAGGSR